MSKIYGNPDRSGDRKTRSPWRCGGARNYIPRFLWPRLFNLSAIEQAAGARRGLAAGHILNIDGRKPISVAHAMRILGSRESGEELEIEIIRAKRKRTITLEIPDNRHSSIGPGFAPQPPMAPHEKVVVIDEGAI